MRKITTILAAWMLSACTLSSSEPQVVIVTAPPVEQTAAALGTEPGLVPPTAVPPTPTSAPTLTPTPSEPPEITLQRGNRLRINGFYEEAVRAYRATLAGGDAVPADIRAEALYSLGETALREGLFADAVEALTTLIDTLPDDANTPLAYFLRGDAYLGLSQWSAAIADFQQYLALRPGLADSYAYERIGDAQLALNQRDAALQNYAQAVATERSLVPLLILREKVAQIRVSGAETAQAIAEYDAILAIARNDAYRASIQSLAASAFATAGDTENELARLRLVFDNYPTTAEAYSAMLRLDEAGIDLDNYERGQVAFAYGDYELAVEAFNTYSTEMQLAAIPAEMYLLLGRSYRELGNFPAAEVAFQTVIQQYPQSELFGEALLEQGRTRFLSGDVEGAIERYTEIANTYDYLTDTAAEALWRVGYLYGTNEQPGPASQTFEQLADAYPNTEQATSGLFLGASTAYAAGDTTTAERLYARLATTATGEDQATAYFWVGQIARQRGDQQQAETAFRLAFEAAPESYFSARARDLVEGVDAFEPPAEFVFEFDQAADITEAEDWLRATFGVTQEGALWPLSPALEADSRLIRGRELWQLAAYEDAETEFFDLINERRDQNDALGSYQLAVYLRSIGAYYPSVFAAANVIILAGEDTLTAPPFIARMRYPVYYQDVIQDVAARRNIDPLVMASLIRQESLFNTNATAAAGEKGLMQVIPSTGDYIASQLQWPDYQHSDLFRPYAGIEFGAFYLEEQLNRFNGNTHAALAGYNAGPGRASDWLQLSGGDPDLFMTAITISSTRQYVQLIYRNYAIYRELYGT